MREGVPGEDSPQPSQRKAQTRYLRAFPVSGRDGPGPGGSPGDLPPQRRAWGGRMSRYLAQEDLARWLGSLMADQRVVAPVRKDGLLQFQPVASVEEIALDFTNSHLPPKEWLFPKTEVLFTIHNQDGATHLEPA